MDHEYRRFEFELESVGAKYDEQIRAVRYLYTEMTQSPEDIDAAEYATLFGAIVTSMEVNLAALDEVIKQEIRGDPDPAKRA